MRGFRGGQARRLNGRLQAHLPETSGSRSDFGQKSRMRMAPEMLKMGPIVLHKYLSAVEAVPA